MSEKVLLLARVVIVFLPILSHAQLVGFLEWEAFYDGSHSGVYYHESAQLSAIDAGGNVYVKGTQAPINLQGPSIQVKFTRTGQVSTTTKSVTFGTMGQKQITDCVYLSERKTDWQNITLIHTSKSDPNGWSVQLDHPVDTYINQYANDQPVVLAVDEEGDVIILVHYKTSRLGYTYSSSQYATVRYRGSDGKELWKRFFSDGVPAGMVLDNNGNVYVIGSKGIVVYDKKGNEIWSNTESGNRIALDTRGYVYVARIARTQSLHPYTYQYYWHNDIEVVKYTGKGQELWRKKYERDFDDWVHQVLVKNGSVYINGYNDYEDFGGSGSPKPVTIKYRSDGTFQWAAYDNLYFGSPADMDIDSDGNVYITTNRENFQEWITYKFDASDGHKVWEVKSPAGVIGATTGQAIGTMVDANDNVFVSGTKPSKEIPQPNMANWNIVTIKYTQDEDMDGDGVPNSFDNCPAKPNTNQFDSDGDNVGDVCDNCPNNPNEDQRDTDRDYNGQLAPDGKGDICDNCPDVPNPNQEDGDNDGAGDVCDNCPQNYNPDQADLDLNHLGNWSPDGYGEACDNCPGVYNADQKDTDGDGMGDACDPDDDNDGIPDRSDNCPLVKNSGQKDTDGDGIGDACNDYMDSDNDEWADHLDNCPDTPNTDQVDANNNGVGDICEVDLSVKRVEITQAIQDKNNSAPLVYGKDTWVRVYFNVGQAQQNIGPISGMLSFLDGSGTPIPTYLNSNSLSTYGVHVLSNSITARPAADFDPLNPAHTLNFRIPGNWRWSEVPYISINVNYSGDDINPGNNSPAHTYPLYFHDVELNIFFVPGYSCAQQYFEDLSPCPPPNSTDFWQDAAWVKKVYPISRINMIRGSEFFIPFDPTDKEWGFILWSMLWFVDVANDPPLNNIKYFAMVCKELNPQRGSNPILPGKEISGMGCGQVCWGIRTGYNSSETFGGETMAHEIGHTLLGNPDYGNNFDPIPAHVYSGCGAHGPYFSKYPNDIGKIDENGFTTDYDLTGNPIPFVYDKNKYYDFMSYAPCEKFNPSVTGDGRWVSTYIYKTLFEVLNNSPRTLAKKNVMEAQEYLIIAAILQDNVVTVIKSLRLFLSNVPEDEPDQSPYSIELRNRNGTPLISEYLKVTSNDYSTAKNINQTVPYAPGTQKIVIKHNNAVIKTINVSANEPKVLVSYPNGGNILEGNQNISWTAEDADGDPLQFDVLYSKDNGSHWEVIALGLNQTNFIWDTDRSAGSDRGLIKVLATDGVNTGEDVSDYFFTVIKKSPEVTIFSPGNESAFFQNSILVFEGYANDFEDGQLSGEACSWSSSIDGVLAAGQHISADNLSAGEHLITFSATDTDGNAGTAGITVFVSDDTDSDGDGIGDDEDEEPFVDNSEPPEVSGGDDNPPVRPPLPDVKIKISPANNRMRLSQKDTVDIVISGAENIAGFEINLYFNKNIVHVLKPQDVVFGAFLKRTGGTVNHLGPDINNEQGKVYFGAQSVGAVDGAYGNGLLGQIILTAQNAGYSSLQLLDVTLTNPQGNKVPVNLENGMIEVASHFWADLDSDYDVDVMDIQLVAAHWNTRIGDARYDPRYDVDNQGQGDGDIDVLDIQLVASWWNKEIPDPGLVGKQSVVASSEPVKLELYQNNPYIIDIIVKNATGLGGFQIEMESEVDSVQVQSVQLDKYLGQTGNHVFKLGPVFSDQKRRVKFGAYSYGDFAGVGGSGRIASIRFTTKYPDIKITNLIFVDKFGNQMDVGTESEDLKEILPGKFELMQNYPNPFNPLTKIEYSIAAESHVTLKIHNLLGQEIRTLINDKVPPGFYSIFWNGKNDAGIKMPSGIYICTLKADQYRESKKMILIQ
ncbi:thrombospondin type 3 repeat-containing protein [candidate division KSB1 bacterium]|nr:thrombospondin type 3 repeat-containing protein [candidate division KSB1 bacterium]